jgi:hypothetical protein
LCYLRNLDALWPNWRQHGLKTETINLSSRATPARDEPWPGDSGPELLAWLINSDAEPWLPTTRQLREFFDERNAPAPTEAPPQDPDDEKSVFDSLLFGPQEAERKRQMARAAAQRRKTPNYSRVATPIAASNRPKPDLTEMTGVE